MSTAANSEVRNESTYGVLQLTLHAGSYDWKFVPEAGASFTDSGTSACVSSGDTVAPSVPSGLVVSASGSGALVSWSASSDNVGVVGVQFYLDGGQQDKAFETLKGALDLAVRDLSDEMYSRDQPLGMMAYRGLWKAARESPAPG